VAGTVIVVGSVNVDMVFRVPRLPAPGETVAGGSFTEAAGGKGANAAAAAARLGGRTLFVGLVGRDPLGRKALRDLEAAGVDASLVEDKDAHTGVAGILVDEAGENLIAVASGANAEVDEPYVRRALGQVEADGAVVLTNLEVPDDAVAAAAEVAEERGWPLVLNPAPARAVDGRTLARCSVVVANRHEARALGEAEALLDAGASAVVVTLGPEGADLHRPGAPPHHQPAFPVEVADTTGAGDAFCGALAWATAEGRHLEDAVRVAAGAGALACRGIGARTSLPDRAEVTALVSGPKESGRLP
jgi:ribokinase